ncbi:hypothetical protein K3495_g3870 [Podosphaera aphanis]|nr:hypothetical protein K3495_g3870 [Podosphaera aphanis]
MMEENLLSALNLTKKQHQWQSSQVLYLTKHTGRSVSWKGRSAIWIGPYELLGIENETCVIKLSNGPPKFRSTVVKPYYDSNIANANNDTNDHNDINDINEYDNTNDINDSNEINDINDSNENNDNIHPTTNEISSIP